MRSIKNIIIFASCGFILSFVFGLTSHSSFLSILLKAFIFAVCFALLGFAINFVFKKFLSEETSGESSDYSTSTSTVSDSPKTGNVVDITIEDEELERSESQNHFVVGENHQMLNDSDIGNANGVKKSAENGNSGFVPLRAKENIENVSGTEAVSPKEAGTEPDANVNVASSGEGIGLDTLPDMENFAFTESNEGEPSIFEGNSEIIGKSDFSSSSSSKAEPEVKDAELMAKAISSILADENS